MKNLLMFLIIAGSFTALHAQEEKQVWEGYLSDQMCAFRWRGELAEAYAKRHARSCNFDEACMASGYGVMVDGTFIKMTEDSNPKAIAYLESITKRNNILVRVTGVMVEEKLEVEKIETADDRRQ